MIGQDSQHRPEDRPALVAPLTDSPLSVDSPVGDLLAHPAFTGFGRLLLPWDDRSYDEQMPLRRVASLLPYHSRVDPAVVVDALNRMIGDVEQGRPVFYRFYDEAHALADPSKLNTGLFFFRGKPGAPCAVISAGGGFAYVGALHEGFPYAQEVSAQGYNAFVLRYRAGHGGKVATEDLAAAVTFIAKHEQELGVQVAGYSLWGSSAGARMAAAVGSPGVARFGRRSLPKPSTVVMAYTGLLDHSTDEPATFVVVGERDGIAPPAIMERRIAALRRLGTAVEYHRYPDLGHGFGLGTGTSAEGWIAQAIRFWEEQLALAGVP
jgi:acetyl esterase/lipase